MWRRLLGWFEFQARIGSALVAIIIVVAGCTAGSPDTASEAPDVSEEVEPLQAEAVELPPTAPSIPGLFTAGRMDELTPSGQSFSMTDVIYGNTGQPIMAGSLRDFDARTQSGRIVRLGPPDLVGNTEVLEIIDLPATSDRAEVEAVALTADGRLIAGGRQTQAGRYHAVVWLEQADGFALTVLPEQGDGSEVIGLAPDGTAAIGYVRSDSKWRGTVWLADGSDWHEITLEQPPGADEVDVYDIVKLEPSGDYLAVGLAPAADSDQLVTGFWIVDNRTNSSTWRIPTGVPPDVALTGISPSGDGEIVIVGSTSRLNSDPIVLRSEDYRSVGGLDTWTQYQPEIDYFFKIDTAGKGLAGVEEAGGRLVTWTVSSFARQFLESNDGGRTWTQLDDFAGSSAGRAVYGVAVAGDEVIAGANSGVYVYRTGWRQLIGEWTVEHDFDVDSNWYGIADDGTYRVAGLVSPPSYEGGGGRLMIYQSADAATWENEDVTAPGGRVGLVPVFNASEPLLFTSTSRFDSDPLNVWDWDGQSWSTIDFDPVSGMARSIPKAAVSLDEGGTIVATLDFRGEDGRLVPRLLSPDGTMQTGSFDVEQAMQTSAGVPCLVKTDEGLAAVVSASGLPDVYLTSENGLAWTTIDELDEGDTRDCQTLDGELVLSLGRSGSYDVRSLDGVGGQGTDLDLPTDVNVAEITTIDGHRFAVGSALRGDVSTAVLLWQDESGWHEVPTAETGLMPDDFGSFTWVNGLSVLESTDEIIIAGGDDVGRIFWRADREALLSHLGLDTE